MFENIEKLSDQMASASVSEKKVMVLAMDEHEHSSYALEWTLDHFFTPFLSIDPLPFKLVIIYAKPSPPLAVNVAGPGISHLSFLFISVFFLTKTSFWFPILHKFFISFTKFVNCQFCPQTLTF